MLTYRFSRKQAEVMDAIVGGEQTFTVVAGPVRSGKTLSALVGFVMLALANPGVYLLATPTMAQLRGVIIRELVSLFGELVQVRYAEKRASIGETEFYLYSANDEGAEGAIRGYTFGGVYIDEAALVPESFIQQAVARCSDEPRRIVMCTNPENPWHHLKQNYIDRAPVDDAIAAFAFSLDDNPSLPEGYKAMLRSTLTGEMLKRWYYGEWAEAAGAIYPGLSRYMTAPVDAGHVTARYIGVDYGETNPTHAVLVEAHGMERYVVREWRHVTAESGAMTYEGKAQAILTALGGDGAINGVYVDPSAPALIAAFRRLNAGIPVVPAVNDVAIGIQQTRSEFEGERLYVDPVRCTHLAAELSGYTWDARAAERGQQVPVKRDDHGPDALRYVIASTMAAGRRVGGVRDLRPKGAAGSP